MASASLAACAPSSADAPQRDIDPTPTASEPWTPSEEWNRLNAWDQEIRAMGTEGDAWDAWKAERAEFQEYLISNPDADAPCHVWYRYAPPELHHLGDQCYLTAHS